MAGRVEVSAAREPRAAKRSRGTFWLTVPPKSEKLAQLRGPRLRNMPAWKSRSALVRAGRRFVGIDLSPRQIAAGQTVVDALGLTNVELRALSVLDVGPHFGRFDYIVCHGVYSWVPDVVQDKILAVCAENLAPGG